MTVEESRLYEKKLSERIPGAGKKEKIKPKTLEEVKLFSNK